MMVRLDPRRHVFLACATALLALGTSAPCQDLKSATKLGAKPDTKPAPSAASQPTKPGVPTARSIVARPDLEKKVNGVSGVSGATGPAAPLPRVYAPTRPREVAPRFPWKEKIPTTVFWIGEQPTENNPVPNHKSSWDPNWQTNYGGYDDPNPVSRNWDFTPKSFTPKLNPFYVALPFNDVTNREIAKIKIPWHKQKWSGGTLDSVCQSRWVAVRLGNKVCYAQWEDCGPFNTDDHNYVFGTSRPKNLENEGAGLDVSPAIRDYLGMSSGALCDWRFVDENERIPDGPWCRHGKNNPFVKDEAKELAKLRAQYAELVRKRDEYLRSTAR